MKLAVTYENGDVFQHFGHSSQFKIYEICDKKIVSSQIVETKGAGHGALAGFLKDNSVDTLICGGIGPGAVAALEQNSIKIYGGIRGSADLAVQDFIDGDLAFNPNPNCNHHHGDDHDCHSHSCGENCGNP